MSDTAYSGACNNLSNVRLLSLKTKELRNDKNVLLLKFYSHFSKIKHFTLISEVNSHGLKQVQPKTGYFNFNTHHYRSFTVVENLKFAKLTKILLFQ
jgi:hypothetical protein